MAKRKELDQETADAIRRLVDHKALRGWKCVVEKRTIPAPYLPLRCRLWLPKRNVAAPGHEKCGMSDVWIENG